MGRDRSGQQVRCLLYAATLTNAPLPYAKPGKLSHEGPRASERLKQILDVFPGDGIQFGGATILSY